MPFFFLLELLPKQIPLGCFKEKRSSSSRLLSVKFGSFSSSYDEEDPYAMVIRCTHLARDMDYEYFAVQNFGDCCTDSKIVDNYNTYGIATPDKCLGGVGALLTNYVYRLRPAFIGSNVCDTVPCKNGGTCVVHFNDPDKYHCECGSLFAGDNCESKCYFEKYVNLIFFIILIILETSIKYILFVLTTGKLTHWLLLTDRVTGTIKWK